MSQQPPPSPNPFANQPSFNQPMPSGQPHRQQGQPTNGIGLTGYESHSNHEYSKVGGRMRNGGSNRGCFRRDLVFR